MMKFLQQNKNSKRENFSFELTENVDKSFSQVPSSDILWPKILIELCHHCMITFRTYSIADDSA